MLPTHIDDYRIIRALGSGGMGSVYEAVHQALSRRVAIKVVRPEVARDPEVEQRFLNEARALASINHPGVVQVFSFGVLADGSSYLVMELLHGETLAQRWRRAAATRELNRELALVHQVCEALVVLHRSGVIHRDIKPENIMVISDQTAPSQERAKLVDLGLAKRLRMSGPRSASDLIMGTPAYMSPEQCRGAGQVDEQTDSYALGVMLYELIAGRLPFESEFAGDLIGMHLHVEPQLLTEHAPHVDPRLAALVHSLLIKDKARRPQMAEATRALGELLIEFERPGMQAHSSSVALDEAHASTLPGPALPKAQAALPNRMASPAEAETASRTQPSQRSLKSLFKQARQARIFAGGAYREDPLGKHALLVLESAEMSELAKSIQLKEKSPLRRCSCLGDLTVELLGSAGRIALLSYHSHDTALLGYKDWDRDATLQDVDALLRLMQRHGVSDVPKKLLDERHRYRGINDAFWLQQPRIQPIMQNPQPKPALDEKSLLKQIVHAQTPQELRSAAKLLVSQAILGSHPLFLSKVPDEAWKDMLSAVSAGNESADLILRLRHAQRIGQAQQARSRQSPIAVSPALTSLGRSPHGPLSSLVTDGIDLYCTAGHALLRISVPDGTFAPVMRLPARDFEISCCGPSLLLTSKSAGLVGRVHVNGGPFELLAGGRPHPYMPFHCGWKPHWLEQEPPPNRLAALVRLADEKDTCLSMVHCDLPGAIGDDDFFAVLEPSSEEKSQLQWFRHDGLAYASVPESSLVKAGPGTPQLSFSASEVFWTAGDKVLSAGKLHLDSQVRVMASGPVAAIALSEQGLYALVGQPSDRTWHVEFAPARQQQTSRLGSFERRAQDRVSAVALGDALYFVCDDSLYSAWSSL